MKKGFTLIEILLYVGILSVVAGLFIGILLTTTRVQISETSANEVNNQLNFTLQTIQRLVRESSNIEIVCPSNSECNSNGNNPETKAAELVYMKLRMEDPALDPTCISQVGEAIYISQGPQAAYPNDVKCKEPTNTDKITTDKITVPTNPTGLEIVKHANYPAHDSIQIDLTFEFATNNPQAVFKRKLQTAIGRVSAATFDSDILPGETGTKNIGSDSNRWQDGYFSGNVEIENNLTVGKADGSKGYLRFTRSGEGDPPSVECGESDTGRLYIKTNTPQKLFLCVKEVWKSISLN